MSDNRAVARMRKWSDDTLLKLQEENTSGFNSPSIHVDVRRPICIGKRRIGWRPVLKLTDET
jgi:hypothetical protein